MNEKEEPFPPAPLNGARATELDEVEVLADLTGSMGVDGVFREAGT